MASWAYLFLLLLPFCHLASPSNFHPHCTLPSTGVNIVYSTNIRSTFDILWSSLFTLFICTWTVQHLNIPVQNRDCETWQGVCKRAWRKLKWIIITLVLPEFLVGRALQDFMMARKSCRQMKSYAKADGVPWSMAHAYFANMGGFVFRIQVCEQKPFDEAPGTLTACLAPSFFPEGMHSVECSKTVMSSIAAKVQYDKDDDQSGQDPLPPSVEMFETIGYKVSTRGNYAINDGTIIKVRSAKPPEWHTRETVTILNADQIATAREHKLLKQLPRIPSTEIQDKSKGDAFVKGIALIKVNWLIIQVISRGAKGLPISQVEIAVLAFSACTFLTYILSWSKPQNVDTPIYIHGEANIIKQRLTENELPIWASQGHSWFLEKLSPWLRTDSSGAHSRIAPLSFPNDLEYWDGPLGVSTSKAFTFLGTGIVVAGVVFGALHCIAWSFHFPSTTERLLWRLASVVSTLLLPLYGAIRQYRNRIVQGKRNLTVALTFLLFVLSMIYVVARVVLIVLIFRCLFSLPPKAFVTTWTTQLPYV